MECQLQRLPRSCILVFEFVPLREPRTASRDREEEMRAFPRTWQVQAARWLLRRRCGIPVWLWCLSLAACDRPVSPNETKLDRQPLASQQIAANSGPDIILFIVDDQSWHSFNSS